MHEGFWSSTLRSVASGKSQPLEVKVRQSSVVIQMSIFTRDQTIYLNNKMSHLESEARHERQRMLGAEFTQAVGFLFQ